MSCVFWNSPFNIFRLWLTAGHQNHGKRDQEQGGPQCRCQKKKDGCELANNEPRGRRVPGRTPMPPSCVPSLRFPVPGTGAGREECVFSDPQLPLPSPKLSTLTRGLFGRRWSVCTLKLPPTKTAARFSHALRLGLRGEEAPTGPRRLPLCGVVEKLRGWW